MDANSALNRHQDQLNSVNRSALVKPHFVRLLVSALGIWIGLTGAVLAQDWPVRTVRIIIGAGGGGDVFARLLAEQLQKRLGHPFVVENRPGGGLRTGARHS